MRKTMRGARYAAIAVLCFLFILPLIWLLQASFKDSVQIFRFPPNLVPSPFVWQNYDVLFRDTTNVNMLQSAVNSLFLCGMTIFAAVFTNTIISYGFSRFTVRGKEIIFLIVLGTMMVPGQLLWIPRYMLFSRIGWIGSYNPMIIPPLIGGNALYIFFLRQFMRGISMEHDEAAEIDGAGPLRVLFSILVPMLKPGIFFIVITEFVARWKDFMEPLIYLKRQATYTLSLTLFQFQAKMQNLVVMHSQGEDPTGAFMAMCVLILIPPLIIYVIFQQFFMEGVKLSGIKG
jgi:multiple sugar transport system permease protein